jgi:PAS domain S-box-containing protein
MEKKTAMKLAAMALVPERNSRDIIKIHPKYLFSLAGFGFGSLIALIIIVAEEYNDDVSSTISHSHLHHLAIPVLFGILGMIIGYIYGKKRHTKEEAFQEIFSNQQTMSLILDHLPLLISYLDTDLRYRYANKTYEKWMGLSMQEIFGKPVKDIVVKNTYDALLQVIPKALQGKIVRFNTSREMNGKEKSLHVVLVPHMGENRLVKGFFSIVGDITQLQKREKKIRMQKDKLEELNATKDKFLSIIAHDLKNPFNALLGFSELLHLDYETLDDLQKREIINLLYKNSQNTYKLLENLLEWARSQSGAIEYSPTLTNIKNLVDENLNLLQSVAVPKSIHLKSSVSEGINVNTDADLVKTVIRNLVSNAIKFTNENGEVVVSAKLVSTFDGKDILEISVADTGIGISPENQRKLFMLDKNYSIKGTNGELGTGLGLILCKEFVEKCGGKIWVESIVAKGSRFCFTLPNDKALADNIFV